MRPVILSKTGDGVARGIFRLICQGLLDDIIIYSENHLNLGLEWLRTLDLRCSLKKCKFGLIIWITRDIELSSSQYNEAEPRRVEYQSVPHSPIYFLSIANWLRNYSEVRPNSSATKKLERKHSVGVQRLNRPSVNSKRLCKNRYP